MDKRDNLGTKCQNVRSALDRHYLPLNCRDYVFHGEGLIAILDVDKPISGY